MEALRLSWRVSSTSDHHQPFNSHSHSTDQRASLSVSLILLEFILIEDAFDLKGCFPWSVSSQLCLWAYFVREALFVNGMGNRGWESDKRLGKHGAREQCVSTECIRRERVNKEPWFEIIKMGRDAFMYAAQAHIMPQVGSYSMHRKKVGANT